MLNGGCAVLSAEVVGGHLDASIDLASVLMCEVEAPGSLAASLGGHARLNAEVYQAHLSAISERHASLHAKTEEHAVLAAAVVCELGERPYLEIDPTYLWILPDLSASNDVYSNTHWNVN